MNYDEAVMRSKQSQSMDGISGFKEQIQEIEERSRREEAVVAWRRDDVYFYDDPIGHRIAVVADDGGGRWMSGQLRSYV